MKLNTILAIILVGTFICIATSYQDAGAAERAIRVQIPKLVSMETASRVGDVLDSTDGVLKSYTDAEKHTAMVLFDDSKISVTAIKQVLVRIGFPVRGSVKYIKTSLFKI
jgi:hypothetical protein